MAVVADGGAQSTQPCIHLAGVEALRDETSNDAGHRLRIERSGGVMPQTAGDRVIEERRLVDIAERLIDRGSRRVLVDAELPHALQDAPPPAPAHRGFESRRRHRHARIVERAVGRQSRDHRRRSRRR